MFLQEELGDNVTAIRHVHLYDSFTKQSTKPMKDFLENNNIPYNYYYFSRETMSDEILNVETQYEATMPMIVVEAVTTDSEFINEVDENGEYVFEEKEDGYIYPVLKEIFFKKSIEVVYDNIEKLNNSKLLEKVSELGVKDVTEEN